MSTEIITGRIAPTEPIREKRGYCLFDPLVITGTDGKARELRKVSAGGEVANIIRRGGEGRFYLGKNAGMAGIHGVRLNDGTAAYSKYHNMELIFIIGAVAGLAMLGIRMIDPAGFMITPVIIGAVLLVGLFIIRSGRTADRQAYERDGV